MKQNIWTRAFSIVALAAVSAAAAQAQATRTWVSGVGDDANPCSRTAPCKTFAGAISKTAPGGEINVLDPGGFGAVTITKSITISSESFEAGVLVSGTNGIVISAGASDNIVLRGLDIEGLGTGLDGVKVLSAGSVSIENCTVNNFTQFGIEFSPSASAKLVVKNTIVRHNGNFVANTGGGIVIDPTGGTATIAEIDDVLAENNEFGVKVQDNATAMVNRTTASGNIFAGFSATSTSAAAVMNIESSVSFANATVGGAGVVANGAQGLVRMSNVHITKNSIGVNPTTGQIVSFQNNRIVGNTTNIAAGTFTTQVQQ